jgi:hypothetical protein
LLCVLYITQQGYEYLYGAIFPEKPFHLRFRPDFGNVISVLE